MQNKRRLAEKEEGCRVRENSGVCMYICICVHVYIEMCMCILCAYL